MIRFWTGLGLAVAVASAAWTETLRVPADHGTIQSALDAAPAGATVTVSEGTYDESLRIEQPVTLEAEGSVLVQSIDRQRPVLTIAAGDGVTVRGLAFEAIQPRPTQNPEAVTQAVVLISDGAPRLEGVEVRNGSHTGIKVIGDAQPHLEDCWSHGNGQSGAFVTGPDAAPVFIRCRFEENTLNGLVFHGGAGGLVDECTFADNEGNGAAIIGRGTAPVITDSVAVGNAFNGIVVMEGGAGEVRGNEARENRASGINLQVVDDALIVRENRSEENTYSGLFLLQATAATIERNSFIRNGVISSGEIGLLIREDDFASLDALAERLVADESRFPSGAWQIAFYYDYLFGAWRARAGNQEQTFEGWVNAWIEARPETVAGRVTLARWLSQQAWTARGGADAAEVSAEAWETFAERLREAEGVLRTAVAFGTDHPPVYAELVHVVSSLHTVPEESWPGNRDGREALPSPEDVFEDARTRFPRYVPLYTQRVNFLLPRWGAEPGAAEAFAADQADATADELGDGLYAILANHLLHSFYLWTLGTRFYQDFAFDWPRVVRGHRELVDLFPASAFWAQSLALHASLQGDKEIAAEVFTWIDASRTAWDSDVWQVVDRFNTYRAWALGEGPYPDVSMDLLLAVQMGDTDAAAALLEDGAVLDAIGDLGYSPLTYAVDHRNEAMTALLLAHGADPDFQPFRGVFPLHRAASRDDIGILEALLTHGADPDILTTEGSTPLMYAAFSNRVAAIGTLLAAGAAIDGTHPTGSTALIVAVRQGHVEAASALLAAGAATEPVTLEGETALGIAMASGNEALVALFDDR